jgi:hypothetical protein
MKRNADIGRFTKPSKFHALSSQEKRLFLQAMASLPLVRIGLKTVGYQRLRSLLAKATRRQATPRSRQADVGNIARAAAQMVHIAARTRLGRANCLPRALTLWGLLRRKGIDSDLCIGVQKNSGTIQAHAWVEYQGQPLNEAPDVQLEFASLLNNVRPEMAGIGSGPAARDFTSDLQKQRCSTNRSRRAPDGEAV